MTKHKRARAPPMPMRVPRMGLTLRPWEGRDLVGLLDPGA